MPTWRTRSPRSERPAQTPPPGRGAPEQRSRRGGGGPARAGRLRSAFITRDIGGTATADEVTWQSSLPSRTDPRGSSASLPLTARGEGGALLAPEMPAHEL